MWTPRHLNKTHGNLHSMESDRESAKVFVAKIPYYISEKDIISKFEKYGSIAETKLLYHEDGAFRGSAFIKYASDESARKCLALDGATVFSDEILVVRPAQDKWSYQKKKGAHGFYFQSQARFPDQFQRRNSFAQSGTSSSYYSTMDSENKMTCDGMKIPVESRPTYGAAMTRPKPTYLLSPGLSDTDRRATYGPSAQPEASQKLHLPTHYNPGLAPYTNTQNGSGLGGTTGGGNHFGGGAIISADLQISESVPIMNKSSNPSMGGHPMHTETTGTSDGHTATTSTPDVHTTTSTPDGHSAGIQPKDYPIHQARRQQQHFQTQYERQHQMQELLFGTSDEGHDGETHNYQHHYLNTNQHTHMHQHTRQHEHQHQHHYHHQHMFSSLDTNTNNTNINSNNTNINITINGINGALNGFNSFLPQFNGNAKIDNDFSVVGGGIDPRDFPPPGYGFVDNQHTSSHTTQLGEAWHYNPYCVPEFGTQKDEWQNGILKPLWSMGDPLGKCADYRTDIAEETKKVAEVAVSDKKADSKPFKWTTGNLPTRFGFVHFEQPPVEGEAVSEITDGKRLKPCASFWL